jgi:hypothetical protein
MCEALGTEPVPSEVPVMFSDFDPIIQQYINIYYLLRDIWDPMGGNYLGKDYGTLFDFFKLYEIDPQDQLFALTVLQQFDSCRSKLLAEKRKQQEALSRQKA